MSIARKLLALSPTEWRDLFAAQFALLRAEWRMRTRPKGELVARWSAAAPGVSVERREVARALQVGEAVRRVALAGLPRSQCLARSLAICDLLEREGIPGATIRIGVRPNDRTLAAHAWVEVGGEIVGDSRIHVRGFEPLASATGAGGR